MCLVEYQPALLQVNHKKAGATSAQGNFPRASGEPLPVAPANPAQPREPTSIRAGTYSALTQGMKLAGIPKVLLRFSPLLLALAPACAMSPPAQSAGTLARDGVEVAVVGQRCTETVETDWPGANLVQATVEFQVRNSNPNPVTVNREQLYLRGSDGRRVMSRDWNSNDAVQVASGQTQTFQLRYMTRGGISCTKPMQLDAESGISVGAVPLRIGSVTFVPSRA